MILQKQLDFKVEDVVRKKRQNKVGTKLSLYDLDEIRLSQHKEYYQQFEDLSKIPDRLDFGLRLGYNS